MNTVAFLAHLKQLVSYKHQVVHVEEIPARPARYGRLDRPLAPPLARALQRTGVEHLFTHQAQAINAIGRGDNVVISTSTASGKTLCYNLPVLDTILRQRAARALYLFPTKALAQDQLRSLHELVDGNLPGIQFATFDGDTPPAQRSAIKRQAQIVLTNPDMLSLGILPNHTSWAQFLSGLRYVVIDEAHTYRGIFGSHVANVIRRLRRLCYFYGARPQFICASATLANPQEHVERLVGEPFVVVDDDGSPHGPRTFVFWNPPVISEKTGERRSTNFEATSLFVELVKAGIRNITFARTRKVAELILLYAREALQRELPREALGLENRIKAYRAGYRPEDRRQIERDLASGQLIGVTATNALELGVDIGDLDAVVMTGYPGSIASTWQQAGRAGRGNDPALAVLVAQSGPLDQYYMRHPQAFFGRPHEHALINPDNPYVLTAHLLCAAYEAPITVNDGAIFTGGRPDEATVTGATGLTPFEQAIIDLERQRILRYTGDRWFYQGTDYPAQRVNIRSASSSLFQIVDVSRGRQVLETIEEERAYYQLHPGAIYLHQGETYRVDRLDLNLRVALVRPVDVNYFTEPKELTSVDIIQSLKHRLIGKTNAYWGRVQVTTQVIGYRRKQQYSETVLADEPLDLPAQSYETRALWFDVDRGWLNREASYGLDAAGALHAVEHASIGLLPLYALCDRNDIGGLSTLTHPDTGLPQVFIYDGYPGGVGISEKGFELLEELWRATLQLLRECPCEEGCPACVQSPKCGNNNQPLDKAGARRLLQMLVASG